MTFPLAAVKRYARVIGGSTPTPDETNWDGEITWLTPADVSLCHGGEVWKSARTLTTRGLASCSASLAPPGSVVVTTRAPIGNVAVTRTPSATNQGCRTLVPDHRLDSSYLRYQLQIRTEQLQSQGAGSTFRELSGSALGLAQVRVPGLGQQHAIVDFLDRECEVIDQLMEDRRGQHEALEALEQCKIQELLASAPGARSTRLIDLLRERPAYGVLVPRFVDEGVKLVRVNDLEELADRAASLPTVDVLQAVEYRRTSVVPGDVLVSVVGSIDHSAVVPASLAGANVARAVARLQPARAMPSSLLWAWTRTTSYLDQARVATVGDTAQPTLNMGDLARFRLTLPDDFAERVAVSAEIEELMGAKAKVAGELREAAACLREYRLALITEAVTGKLDTTRLSGQQLDESARAAIEGEQPEVLA